MGEQAALELDPLPGPVAIYPVSWVASVALGWWASWPEWSLRNSRVRVCVCEQLLGRILDTLKFKPQGRRPRLRGLSPGRGIRG